MNIRMVGQLIVSLNYVGRCPTWHEYETGSPAERRAIPARWSQIVTRMGRQDDSRFYAEALKNYCRYCAETKTERGLDKGDYRSTHADWSDDPNQSYTHITPDDWGV